MQVAVQRSVIPGKVVALGQSFQAGDESLRQGQARTLIRRVAIIGSAAQRPGCACGASSGTILPGTALTPIQRHAGAAVPRRAGTPPRLRKQRACAQIR